jgi:hypothetical protein
VTEQVKDDFVSIFVDNDSGESAADERKMFDTLVKFSLDGELPAVAYGVSFAAKPSMKDDFVSFLAAYPTARYVVAANSRLYDLNYHDGELIATNFDVTPSGQIVTWDKVTKYLENEFSLIQIFEEEEPPPAGVVAGLRRATEGVRTWIRRLGKRLNR